MATQREQNPTPDEGYFGSNSVTWELAREALINLGGGRAVLMQLAHPLVAMGVSEHSSYMRDPFGRTWRTFLLGQMLTFGSTSTARQAARTINRLHTHVYGKLPEKVGAYRAGTPYRARDPELLLWVQATLIDTVLLLYPLLFRPLSAAEQEQYYQESRAFAALLGLPASQMPTTIADLRRYVHDMVYSDRLAATPQARQLAYQVLFPPVPAVLRPLMHLQSQLTCALLPQPVREIYGLEWSPQRQLAFELSMAGMRMVMPHLPLAMRVLPITRRLMEHGKVA